LKTVIALIKKEFILFWKDKVAVSLTFLVPAVLIFIFGSVFGGSGNISGIHIAFINDSEAPIALKLEKTLDTTKTFFLIKKYKDEQGNEKRFDTNSVKDFVKKGSASAALVIPADAYTDTSLGLKLKYYYDPKNEIETQLIQGMLQKIVMESLPGMFMDNMWRRSEKYLGKDSGGQFNRQIASVIGKYYKVDTALLTHSNLNDTNSDTGKKQTDFFSNMLQIDKEQLIGKEIVNPNVTRNVGGWALMFLLFTLTGAASSIFDEQKSGVILRLLSAPVSGVHILWSKYIFSILLGIIQLFVLFLAGMFFFKIDIFSNIFNLMLVIIAGATACTAFGMLLAAFCRTAAQANGWGTFLILTMSAIGGAWFPTFLMPGFIQVISKFTIVYWAVDGFLMVLWRGASFTDILPNLAFLFGTAVVINTISIIRFRKRQF
jgi:ABC-type multidrug transport system, permease component